MTLKQYIRKIGYKQAMQVFNRPYRTVQSWALGDRVPTKRTADEIVRATHGLITHADIYTND